MLAPLFLPPAPTFGHQSNPSSHRIYRATGEGPLPYLKFEDPEPPLRADGTKEDSMLVELRGDGHHTVWSPSLHESGEPIAWDAESDPCMASPCSLGIKFLAATITYATPEVSRYGSGTCLRESCKPAQPASECGTYA